MIQLNIKTEDKRAIAEGRYSQAHPRVMQKYDALRLKNCGLSNKLICNILGICNNTLLSFFKQYNEGGLARLNEMHFNQPESDLKAFSTTIEKYFEENPPQSISDAAAKIETLTGIKRGETQVRKFLKDKGFRFRRVGTVPAKALGIELLFLPSYSPNLNIIERLWKWEKKIVLIVNITAKSRSLQKQ